MAEHLRANLPGVPSGARGTCLVPGQFSLRTLCATATLAVASAIPTLAQVPVRSVTLGWAVLDTTVAPLGDLVRTVAAYYSLVQPGHSVKPTCTSWHILFSPHWATTTSSIEC